MHAEPPLPTAKSDDNGRPWYKELTRYHWFVLIVAALGWLFDTMDQQLFNIARPAVAAVISASRRLPQHGWRPWGWRLAPEIRSRPKSPASR